MTNSKLLEKEMNIRTKLSIIENIIRELFLDSLFDMKLNIDTIGLTKIRKQISLYKDEESYMATPYITLKRIYKEIRPIPNDIFIDLGSGKGRVTCYFARNKLKKIIGIEIHKDFIEIAKNNSLNLRSKLTDIEYVCIDASQYNMDSGTIFFIFNPFGESTLKKVLKNIENSLIKNQRNIKIIYYNPKFEYLLSKREKWLVLIKEIRPFPFLNTVQIWSNNYEHPN